MGKYTVTHCHTMFSNGVTNIDSVTKYSDYIKEIKNNPNLAIQGICFTEHGSNFEWYKKKCECESNGLKYVHSIEAYITESLNDKIRDNYHVCLYATDYESFKELNILTSKAFNREDGHYYYAPRITYDELINTSDKILISTACLGGILAKGNDNLKDKFIDFVIKNKNRCYLEIQHHLVESQIEYNKYLYKLHKQHNIPLIVGTDTHALNDKHSKGREILQKGKGVYFDNEEGWDLTLKSYDELVKLFMQQNIMSTEDIYESLENTNKLYDRIQEFKINTSYKYPKLYDNSLDILKQKINKGISEKGINKFANYRTEYIPRIHHELDTYIHNGAVDFLLLDEDIKTWARSENIFAGYSRGSCSGSLIAYIIGMTDIDSVKHKMNFERFMNTERVSLADVDTDWSPNQRELVKDYIYSKKGLYCADIITFNTVALKGSIRDVCRALYKKESTEEMKRDMIRDDEGYGKLTDSTSKKVHEYVDGEYLKISNYICENIDSNESKMRKEYPKVFEYVDIINGTIVSIGTHPCGLICSPIPLNEVIGLCSISNCTRPVSMISMKAIDSQNFVKLDLLGLDNIQIINETCELANIDRLTPENTPNKEEVWLSMAEDNTLIFQWESDSAGAFLKTLLSEKTISKIEKVNPNFRYIDLVSMGNGAIRPAGASYRDALSNGEFRDNGHKALNDFLAPTMGYLVYQEQIMSFLHLFCGYTMGEADIVRRGFAKKTGTEQFIPKIKDGFIKTMKDKYNVEKEESEKLIVNFIQIIVDASDYLFSENHAVPYTYIGYIAGYLRYYYPLEFITTALNVNKDKEEKTVNITKYANSKGIKILSPKFGYAKDDYFMSKETNSIYKGVGSVKNLNSKVANELYELYQQNKYNSFLDLLIDIKEKTSCNTRQLEILIKLDYFDIFGKAQKLLDLYKYFQLLYNKKAPKKSTLERDIPSMGMIKYVEQNCVPTESTYGKLDWYKSLLDIWDNIVNRDIKFKERLSFHNDILGYIDYRNEKIEKRYVLVTDINTKYTPVVNTYCLNNGSTCKCKISKKLWNNDGQLNENDIIYIHAMEKKFGFKKVGETTDKKGKIKPIFEEDQTKTEWWITNYSVIHNMDEVLDEIL